MASTSSLVNGFTISALPTVATVATELPGGLFEVEVLVGPPGGLQVYMNKQLTIEQLLTYLSGKVGGGGGSGPQTLSLADAQAQIPVAAVLPNGFYTIQDTTWNGNMPATVYVQGLTPTTFAPTGWMLDANDVYQPVRVDVAAGTVDTRPLRDLQLFQAGDVNANGEVLLWLGDATTPAGQVKEVLL